MKKISKTNAIRQLESMGLNHEVLTYSTDDGKIDGISVANKVGHNPEYVYKTLVACGSSKNLYVFCTPVEFELDLKKAAIAAKEKKIEMIPVKDLLKHTGYIRGGCSPIGMKKLYPTFIDETATLFDNIIFSGGALGIQIMMNAEDLARVINGKFVDLLS